jgi:hypothetical protein
MEQSPTCDANSYSDTQEIPRLLWYPKVHYRVPNCPPLVPILGQMNPFHILISYFFKIHFSITLQSRMPKSPMWSLTFRLPVQNSVCIIHLS